MDCVVDDVAWAPQALPALNRAFEGLLVLRVGVQCPTGVAQDREASRGDRLPGGAALFANVIDLTTYDLVVHADQQSPAEGAARIVRQLGLNSSDT
jgi:chloramphenicol 3-O phosphotransferase